MSFLLEMIFATLVILVPHLYSINNYNYSVNPKSYLILNIFLFKGTCCLADFGLAFKHVRSDNGIFKDQPPRKILVGTARYRAPELLKGQINVDDFQVFIKTDIYSFALCLWEICRRTKFNGLYIILRNISFFPCIFITN